MDNANKSKNKSQNSKKKNKNKNKINDNNEKKTTLNYISWNVRTFSNNKISEIAGVLQTYDVDVFLVQETRKTAKEIPAIPGYNLARLGYSDGRDLDPSTKSKKSLVAIYIKDSIPYTSVG